ncbi:hypothetical protein QN277_010549 [Acacia crassicarpa]|uniref:Retroviral polymerase SH3-like domain-containing protein n=1 Tax=Acacia crassicarpa TaxID=499986 RepID=A0AAE1JHH5_9FABA|nr:hypothetical protein QN277_010549 [Acacia crassicarpa]
MHSHGILHQSSCVDIPAQNVVAERKNRHLLETACALMFHSYVPKSFWVDDMSTACFLINCMPLAILSGSMPYSIMFPTTKVFLVDPKIFGCVCFVRDVRPSFSKLDPKSLKCVFLGYSRVQKGYRCHSPNLRRYLISIDMTFHKSSSFFQSSTLSESSSVIDEPDHLLVYCVSLSPVPATVPAPDLLDDANVAIAPPSPVTASPTDPIHSPTTPVLDPFALNFAGPIC